LGTSGVLSIIEADHVEVVASGFMR